MWPGMTRLQGASPDCSSALWGLRTARSPLGRTVCLFLMTCSIIPAPKSPPPWSLPEPPRQSNHALLQARQAPWSDILPGLQSDLHFSRWCSVHCLHIGAQSSPQGRHSNLPTGYETLPHLVPQAGEDRQVLTANWKLWAEGWTTRDSLAHHEVRCCPSPGET